MLRGTSLAMDVFDRSVDFDPNSDPIVRIEAVKLRKALDHYYLASQASVFCTPDFNSAETLNNLKHPFGACSNRQSTEEVQ